MRSTHDAWSQLFDAGKDVLSSSADATTGGITCQTGNAVDSQPDGDKAEVWSPAGYYAVPSAPTKGQPSTQAFVVRASDHDYVIATRDPRDAKVIGNLKPGDRCIAGGFPAQSRVFVRADGSICLLTKDDNTVDGNDVYYRLSPTESRFWSPWGSAVHDETGLHLRTHHGAKLDLCGLGLPSPFSSYGSIANLSAGIIRINGTIVQLGQDQGLSMAVLQALPVQIQLGAALTSAMGALQALAAAVAGVTGGASFPALPGAQSAISSATTAMTAAIAALTTTCATKATTAA